MIKQSSDSHTLCKLATTGTLSIATMGSQIGSIRIRDATIDDSLDAIARVYFDGFRETVIHQLMYPGGASASARERFIHKLRNDIASDSSPASPVRLYTKVAELMPPNGEDGKAKPEIVAIAKWKFVKKPLSPEVWDVKDKDHMTQEQLGEGANLEVWQKFMGSILQIRRREMRGDRCLREYLVPPAFLSLQFLFRFPYSSLYSAVKIDIPLWLLRC